MHFNTVMFVFSCIEKTEKLNIKFRLAKEGDVEDTEADSTTIQLVLEGDVESETEGDISEVVPQSTCTAPPVADHKLPCNLEQKDPERAP